MRSATPRSWPGTARGPSGAQRRTPSTPTSRPRLTARKRPPRPYATLRTRRRDPPTRRKRRSLTRVWWRRLRVRRQMRQLLCPRSRPQTLRRLIALFLLPSRLPQPWGVKPKRVQAQGWTGLPGFRSHRTPAAWSTQPTQLPRPQQSGPTERRSIGRRGCPCQWRRSKTKTSTA